ncbi:MAG: hypothetical protein JWO02_2387, partial [Solirubrobacterales bacterium]|nr:hypothetical protein [Solirubrobacterales bacterium]
MRRATLVRMTALELSGPPEGLLDDPLAVRVRGSGGAAGLVWRGRIRDDDGRVWRAIADRVEDLPGAWVPAKSSTSMLMALTSRRPVELEVRVEAPDGRAATRTLKRLLVAEGVRIRRWRGDVPATLHLPPGDGPFPSLVLDATAGQDDCVAVATLAAPLLASRGVLALVVGPAPRAAPAALLRGALEQLAAVPSVHGEPRVLEVLGSQEDGVGRADGSVVVTPPGVGVRGAGA